MKPIPDEALWRSPGMNCCRPTASASYGGNIDAHLERLGVVASLDLRHDLRPRLSSRPAHPFALGSNNSGINVCLLLRTVARDMPHLLSVVALLFFTALPLRGSFERTIVEGILEFLVGVREVGGLLGQFGRQ